jgi:flagellar motor switch protein FliM
MKPNEELLSEEEMQMLLQVENGSTAKDVEKRKKIVPYNFRRPDRLSKEQVRSLYLLHDLFAHSLSSSLPLFLRAISEVNLISVEQQSYADYLRGLTDPTTMFPIYADSLRGTFAVEINSSIAFPIIDRMLGGEGKSLIELRGATDLELKVLEGFLAIVSENYREVWKSIIEFEVEITGRETRPQLLQIVAPNEIVATVVYQIQIGDAKGLMSFCLPVLLIEDVIKKYNQVSAPNNPTQPEATNALLKTISNVRFPVSSELERVSAGVRDLMNLAVGDVLRTNHTIEKPINLKIGDDIKFNGRLHALEGKMVVQLTEMTEDIQSKSAA